MIKLFFDFIYLIAGKLCVRIFSAFQYRAMNALVVCVFLRGSPLKIMRTVIQLIAILVATLLTFRLWAYEGP